MPTSSELGIVGLGSIGGGLAAHALERGMRVVGHDIDGAPAALRRQGLVPADGAAELVAQLRAPRCILLYLPAGPVVDEVLDALAPRLDPGDVVADGGNSYWGDSIRRHQRLGACGIDFLDVGTSGGLDGARHGACFMVGGSRAAVERLEPILRELAVPGGYVSAGPPGAGHFVKLVHNGIEFAMLQAIGEGVHLLERFRDDLDVGAILECWRHGSVIRSWLVDLMEAAYRERDGLGDVPGHVEDTGEVNWLVTDAMAMEVPIPVIAQSVMQLVASRDRDRVWARAIAVMRRGFGGHPLGADGSIAHKRHASRVGPPMDGAAGR